jgi:hypothetical protein
MQKFTVPGLSFQKEKKLPLLVPVWLELRQVCACAAVIPNTARHASALMLLKLTIIEVPFVVAGPFTSRFGQKSTC